MRRARTGLLALLTLGVLAGCSAEGEGFPDRGRSDAQTDAVAPDGGPGVDSGGGGFDVQPRDVQNDNTPVETDGGGVYDDAEVRGDGCPVGMGGSCTPRANGCLTNEIPNDGLDNDCDGMVDEGSSCLPGEVQRCFAGPPGRRGVGVCADGMQTCQGSGEFGSWGPCVGGISPSAETCDDADNDCDGCPDDGLCCVAEGSCPSGDDPRVPVGRPFQDYTLMGRQFFTGVARSWRWRVVGGPCDQLLFATSRRVSYRLNGAREGTTLEAPGENLVFHPTLSGDYTVTLTVTRVDGTTFECTFLVRIRAPGFRVELCWDRTGMTDIDLWVHRPGNTNPWTEEGGFGGAMPSADNCAYSNCRNNGTGRVNWGYPATRAGACADPVGGECRNPRLDIDNISTPGVPENTNVDVPRSGDTFRVAVNYYGGSGAVRPMVNVYCGGALRATYGGAMVDGMLYGSSPIANFSTSGDNASGSLWRVVDVVMDSADSCMLHPLVARGTTNPCVETNTDRTYNGRTCVRR